MRQNIGGAEEEQGSLLKYVGNLSASLNKEAYKKNPALWGTLRKEGAPRIYIWLLFGLWCHNPMFVLIMDIIFLFAVFKTSKFVENH